jgi:Amidohydrolase family
VLTHATVIDVRTGRLIPDQTIVILGHRILSVAARPSIPANAHVVDCTGEFVVPGFWDMHAHALWSNDQAQRMLDLFLANGVTGIRDMRSPLPLSESLAWRSNVQMGTVVGPSIVAAGKLVDGPKPVWPGSVAVETAQQARDAIDSLHAEGVDFIKIYSRLPREAYFAVAAETRRKNIPFVGHVPIYVSATEASTAGQRSIEHLSEILFACSRNESQLRHRLVNTAIGSERDQVRKQQLKKVVDTFSANKATALANLFAKNDTWQVPTLLVQYTYAYVNPDELYDSPGTRYVSSAALKSWTERLRGFRTSRDQSDFFAQKRSYELELKVVRLMHRAGERFMTGTDAETFYPAGFALHKELALFVAAGFSNLEALQAATLNPAIFLGKERELGTVEAGKRADLVLLEANPLSYISNTERIVGVIADGRYFDRKQLDELLSDAAGRAGNLHSESGTPVSPH